MLGFECLDEDRIHAALMLRDCLKATNSKLHYLPDTLITWSVVTTLQKGVFSRRSQKSSKRISINANDT